MPRTIAPTTVNTVLSSNKEIGVTGTKISAGYVQEEFLVQLTGDRGRRIYREMTDNDPTIGSVLFLTEMMLRSTEWLVQSKEKEEPVLESEQDQANEFVKGLLFEDMDHTWDDFVSDVLSMFSYGWSWFEIVMKRRLGPYQTDKSRRSNFEDGRLGIRKLAPRNQSALDHWELDENGEILGIHHRDPNSGRGYFIPIEKSLHFRTRPNQGNPEGRSLLRNSYMSWYYLKSITNSEAIGVDRDLTGVPIIRIPGSIIASDAAEDVAVREAYNQIARDLRFNEQGGVVVPSDTFSDRDGKISNVQKVGIDLLSTSGGRLLDTTKIRNSHKEDIFRTVLAEFILLGASRTGSFALGESKIDLFLLAIKGWLETIAATINRQLLPKIWLVNMLDMKTLPQLVPGRVLKETLEQISTYIERLSKAGMMFFPDPELQQMLRDKAGLPEPSIEIEMANPQLEEEEEDTDNEHEDDKEDIDE